MSQPFVPQQAVKHDGAQLKRLQGDVSDDIARDLLKELPPISNFAVIHDNGCGYGAVTRALMASSPPSDIKIHATDLNPMYYAELQAEIDKNPTWKVDIATMDASALSFPDDKFDLSLTNFVFGGLKDDLSAAQHIFRTLKPGGTAVVAIWQDISWRGVLENAHWKTRGESVPLAPFLTKGWYGKKKLGPVLEKAGWGEVAWLEKPAWLNTGEDLKGWVELMWSLLGNPVGGWTQRDEDSWDDAVAYIIEELKKCDGVKFEDGVWKCKMVASIAIGKK